MKMILVKKMKQQEENEMKKKNELSNYGMHRIIELKKINLNCK